MAVFEQFAEKFLLSLNDAANFHDLFVGNSFGGNRIH